MLVRPSALTSRCKIDLNPPRSLRGLRSILSRLLRPSSARLEVDFNPSPAPPENRIKIDYKPILVLEALVQGPGGKARVVTDEVQGVRGCRGGLVGTSIRSYKRIPAIPTLIFMPCHARSRVGGFL